MSSVINSDMELMPPGRELDALVAEKILEWDNNEADPTQPGMWGTTDWRQDGSPVLVPNFPPYSTDTGCAWAIVERLAPLVGDFHEADGFFILKYADSASHTSLVMKGDEQRCRPGELEDFAEADVERDPYPWSCHFHPGCPGEGTVSAKLFGGLGDLRNYCSRGESAAHAICLAALKIYGVTTTL